MVSGGKLARSGAEVPFVARGAHLAAIRERGLAVNGPEGDFKIASAKVTADLASIGPVDVVLVCVKTWQLPDLLPQLHSLMGRSTLLLPLLNGVDSTAQLSATFGADRVLGGLCTVLSWIESPGVIAYLGTSASVALGALPGTDPGRAVAIRDALIAAGIQASIPSDILAAQWKKFSFITAFGGVGALARAPAGILRSVGPTRALLERALSEAVAVGRQRVALEADQVAQIMANIDRLPSDAFASMARDVFAGRRSELEAWNGAVARIGREAGVPTPVHEAIYGALLPAELRARGEVAAFEPKPAG